MVQAGADIHWAQRVRGPTCSALALLFSFASVLAFADEPSTAEPKEDPAYRAAVRDGLAEYDARHFEEARILFLRAHELEPNARTLRSIGMTSFELRDYVAAVHALSAALLETRKPLSAEQRAHAQGLLERSRLFVDDYVLKVSPPDARVLIDGRAPDREPDGSVLLGIGTHSVEVSSAGYVLRTFPVTVRGGERKELIMTLEQRPTASVRPVGALRTAEESAPPPPRASRTGTAWLLAAGGAAVVAGAAGGYWIFENGELNSCRNPSPGLRCTNESTIKTERNVGLGATLVAGAAAATLAVIGLTRSPSPSASSPREALSCTVLPSGVTCAGSF